MALIRVDVPRGTFAHPPLALVACQINFEPILRLREAQAIAPLQEALRAEYPSLSQVGALQINLGAGGLRAEQGEPSGVWMFASADQKWQVVLGSDNLTIQTMRSYHSYEELRDRFLGALGLFVDQYKPGARLRLGLRYINQISDDGATTVDAWRKLVRPEFLGLAAAEQLVDHQDVKLSFGQARFANDERQILVRYGFVEPGVLTHPRVEPQARPHFLLDMDEFDVRRIDTIDPDAAGKELDGYHEDLYRLFRWSLTDAGVALLDQNKEDEMTITDPVAAS